MLNSVDIYTKYCMIIVPTIKPQDPTKQVSISNN